MKDTSYKINIYLSILFAVLLTFTSGTVWQVLHKEMKYAFFTVSYIILIFNYKALLKKINIIYFCALFLSLFFSIGVIVYSNYYNFALIILLFSCVSIVLKSLNDIDIFYYVTRILYYYSIINLAIYVVIIILHIRGSNIIYLSSADYAAHKAYTSFYSIFYNWQGYFPIFGVSLLRNAGVFVEAGRYGVFLTILLAYQLFISKGIRKVEIGITLVNIITTVSTASIIVALFFVLIKMIMSDKENHEILKYVIVSYSVLFICVLGYLVYVDKLSGEGFSSFHSRRYDMQISLEYFKSKPLFGYGLGSNDIISSSAFNSGNSNGLTKLLYQGGIYLAVFYSILFIMGFFYLMKKYKFLTAASICAMIILQLAAQAMTYDYITLFYLIYSAIALFFKAPKKSNWDLDEQPA